MFRRALPEVAHRDDPGLVARFVEGFRVMYGRGWNVVTRPYSGIHELLDALVSRSVGLGGGPTRGR